MQQLTAVFLGFNFIGYYPEGDTECLQVDFRQDAASHRILNIHQNVPGVLRDVNRIISDLDVNIKAQVRPHGDLAPLNFPSWELPGSCVHSAVLGCDIYSHGSGQRRTRCCWHQKGSKMGLSICS
jgi:hypothetical protein